MENNRIDGLDENINENLHIIIYYQSFLFTRCRYTTVDWTLQIVHAINSVKYIYTNIGSCLMRKIIYYKKTLSNLYEGQTIINLQQR